jgi:hypothetical protein
MPREIRVRRNAGHGKDPDLGAVLQLLAPKFTEAILGASERLREMGVRHALVGGIAVGAHGEPRNTKDVDFLVGNEAFDTRGVVLSFREGLPIRVAGVDVDLIPEFEDAPEDAVFLPEVQDLSSATVDQVPVAPVEIVAYMKLRAYRLQDRADLLNLLQSGHGAKIRNWLRAFAPHLLDRLGDVEQEGEVV